MDDHIAIITVIYNNYEVIKDFVTSLSNQTDNKFHLFISDASTTKKQIKLDGLKSTVTTTENKGYAHGVNIGIKLAQKANIKKYCILNNDIFFDTTFIEKLKKAFISKPNTIFSGKIYYARGFEYHKSQYQKENLGNVLWYAGGEIDWNHATTSHLGVDKIDNGTYDEIKQTDFITGCLMCFDQEVIEAIGYFDEKYFLYFEDSDFCVRAKKNNIKLWYDPNILIWHKNAQSTGGSGSYLHQILQKKAHLRFALKFAPIKTKIHVLKNFFFAK